MQGKLWAQNMERSKTDKLFNLYPPFVNHIHTAYLQKNEKMIIEMADVTDYDVLKNFDSILSVFMKDIEFYKDSLPVTGSVRIDYELTDGSEQKMMRFKKYPPEGDIYIKQKNETAALKLDQDTVHIILKKKPNDRGQYAHFYDWPVQVTFCLNNYSDINTLLQDKGLINAIIDTLSKAIPAPKVNPESKSPFNKDRSTVDYYPYRPYNKMYKTNSILPQGATMSEVMSMRHKFKVNAKLGAGLIMNTITPMADIGLQYNKYWSWRSENYSIFRLSATPYYFFNKDGQGNFVANDNWFVNAAIGSIDEKGVGPEWLGKECTIGAGYLVSQKGGYFKKNTFKIFTDILLIHGITIVPEVIITNNLKQVFPGMTLKVF
jgi:hypothetical protein